MCAKVASARWMAEHQIDCHVAHVTSDLKQVLDHMQGTTFACDSVSRLDAWMFAVFDHLDRLAEACFKSSQALTDKAKAARSAYHSNVD